MVKTQFCRKDDYQTIYHDLNSAGQQPAAVQEKYEIVLVQKGCLEYWIEDQYYKVCSGDILLIPAGVMVSVTLKQKGCPLQVYNVRVSQRFLDFLRVQDPAVDRNLNEAVNSKRYLFRIPKDDQILLQQAFEALVREDKEAPLNSEVSSAAMLSILLVRVNRLLENSTEEARLMGEKNRLSEVLEYIHDHCTESLSVDDLATIFSFSPSHLAHTFKKQLGTSLYHYVLLRRLQIGRQAMLDNVPVKEAYLRCGFGDYAGFYRAFMKEFGMSPQQYKQKYGKS